MSGLLAIMGRGLDSEIGEVLDRYFWTPSAETLEQLQRRCREHPEWFDAQFRLGVTYLRAMQVDQAIEHLAQASRCKPSDLAARLALASAWDEKGDAARALEQLDLANLNRPGEPPILFAIGFCQEKLRHTDRAMEYYRDAIDADPSFVPPRERLAAAALLKGQLDTAIEQYEYFRQTHPEQTWIHTAVAHLYYRQGRYADAVAAFETAISMEPENWALRDDEVEALVAAGELREAIERLHGLIDQQPEFPDLHLRLADLYSQKGDDEAAMRHYRMALDMQPDYLEAIIKIGTQHLISGRWDQAAEAFHDACQRNEQVLVNYVGLGVAHLAAGRRDQGINNFELAATIEPNSTLLLSEVARLQLKAAAACQYYYSFGDQPAVPVAEVSLDNEDLLHTQIERYAEQIAQRPGRADLRYHYGVLLRSEGRLGEALEQFENAADINPGYVQAIIKLGITQQELGRTDEAIETFKRALEIAPEYVDVHYRLGLLFTDRRRFEEAVRHMEAAAGAGGANEQLRAGLALALQNMGLMDRAAATWRSLSKINQTISG